MTKLLVLTLTLFTTLAHAAEPNREAIRAAVPAKSYAEPKAPRKVLVFSVTRGFRHASIPWGIAAIEEMARQTGAFSVVVSDDLANFEREALAQFDAVIFNNTSQNVFLPPPADLKRLSDTEQAAMRAREERLRQNLLGFIASGKGFVGIHAATDTFYEWPGYGRMIGAFFDGHPWNAGDRVTIAVENPGHPVNQGVRDVPRLEFAEECYQFRAPYQRGMQEVLLRLDTERTDMTKPGIKRTDGDFPLAWVRRFGQGRVYYNALGHNTHIYVNPKVLAHYFAGIQWALGDLDAPVPPGVDAEP